MMRTKLKFAILTSLETQNLTIFHIWLLSRMSLKGELDNARLFLKTLKKYCSSSEKQQNSIDLDTESTSKTSMDFVKDLWRKINSEASSSKLWSKYHSIQSGYRLKTFRQALAILRIKLGQHNDQLCSVLWRSRHSLQYSSKLVLIQDREKEPTLRPHDFDYTVSYSKKE